MTGAVSQKEGSRSRPTDTHHNRKEFYLFFVNFGLKYYYYFKFLLPIYAVYNTWSVGCFFLCIIIHLQKKPIWVNLHRADNDFTNHFSCVMLPLTNYFIDKLFLIHLQFIVYILYIYIGQYISRLLSPSLSKNLFLKKNFFFFFFTDLARLLLICEHLMLTVEYLNMKKKI